jgi:hypothetical protein
MKTNGEVERLDLVLLTSALAETDRNDYADFENKTLTASLRDFLSVNLIHSEEEHGSSILGFSGESSMYLLGYRDKGDRLCGLVVRVLDYRSGGPGSIPGTTRKKKVVGLERGPLSLVSTTEKLLDRKVAAPV